MKARGDRLTPDLLDWRPPEVAVGFQPSDVRGGQLQGRIARAISLALKRSGKPRDEIAKTMSAWLGERVSRAMLDAYASEAKTEHQITLARFMALIEATGCLDLLGFVAEPFDHAVVPARYRALIELALIEEHEAEVAARKATLLAATRGGRR